MVDIATRVYNHHWKIDPIVRSLIDTDFYKLLMCQSVFRNRPDTQVTFSLINRTTSVPLARLIDEGALREQLDHIRSLSLSRGESTWLRGNTFYGKSARCSERTSSSGSKTLEPAANIISNGVGDQYELTFRGFRGPRSRCGRSRPSSVLMELRSRAVLRDHGQIRTAGPLCPRDDQASGRRPSVLAPVAGERPAHCRFRNPATAQLSSGRTGACRR